MDNIRAIHYFKVQVSDKPGVGASALEVLRQAGLNLTAFSGFPRGRRAQLDFVPADPETFKAITKRARWKIQAPKTCFIAEGDDRVGAVADVLSQLANAKINVTAMDAVCTGGRYGAIFWVKARDVKKAAKVLGVTI